RIVIREAPVKCVDCVHASNMTETNLWVNTNIITYDVGMTGLIGFSSGYYAMLGCDVLLILGTDFPYRQFYPTDAKIVQVDIRGEKLGNRAPLTMGLVGDVQSTIAALLPRLRQKSDRSFLDQALRHYQDSRKELDELAVDRA